MQYSSLLSAGVTEQMDAAQTVKITENSSHLLHDLLVKQQNTLSERILQLRCDSERYRKSKTGFLLGLVAFANVSISSLRASVVLMLWNTLHFTLYKMICR